MMFQVCVFDCFFVLPAFLPSKWLLPTWVSSKWMCQIVLLILSVQSILPLTASACALHENAFFTLRWPGGELIWGLAAILIARYTWSFTWTIYAIMFAPVVSLLAFSFVNASL